LEADDDLALDDPMAWLEALAVEQDEPVEDLPSVLDTSMYDTITADQLTEISADDEDELPDDEEAAMARLEALAQEQEADLAEEMPLPIDIVNSPDSELLQMLELEAEEPVDLEEADLADELLAEDEEEEAALAWLDSLGEADDFEDLTTVVGPTADDALADLALETEEMSVDEVDLTLADMIVTDDEPTLDWLDALDESEAVLAEEMETAVTPTEDFLETVEVPDDLEEAMAWLDNLEAEEDEPFEAVPTLDELVSLEETIEAGETADTDEDEISWLTELAAQEEEAVEELLTVPEVEVEPEPPDPLQEALDQLEDLALQDSPSFMTADVSDSDESAEMESLDNVLDWLEAQLAAPTEEQTADELLETVEDSQDILEADTFIPDELSVDDDFVIPEEEEETAEASFLEDTFDFPDFEEEAAVEELPDLSDEMSDEMSDDDIMAFMNAILDDDDSFIPEKDVSFTPDDPDAIPSFAVSTQTVEEELVVEVEETADEPQLDEIHDFVEETAEADELADEMSDDDIMAFMDSIFDDDDSFVPEKDVSFTPDDPDAVPSFGASRSVVSKQPEESDTDEFVDVMASLAPEEDEADVLTGLYDDLSDDMSDDDILAFMDAVFDNDDSLVPEKDVSFNPDDPDAVPSFTTTRTAVDEPEEADFGDFSDEPDDAIAWLQDLVDAQEDTEDVEDLDSILPEIDEDFAVELFTDVSEEETADTQDAMEFDETLADSLPDWLEFDGEERLSGHTDWLRSLPEPDVAGWLEAEEEVMASNIFDEIPVPAEPEQSFSYTASYQDEVVSEPEPEMIEEEIELDEEIPAVGVGLTTGILDSARQALAEGQYKQALNQYRNLVEEGQGLSTLIADLETATEEYPQPLLRRLLGDAYMRNGQLQRALETYRIALDEL
jgi:hypothetical protein